MASLSNINGLFDVHSTGAILFSTSHGTSGQILKSNGNAAPTWIPQSDIVGAYLPLAGGTLTGATATASGISFSVGGALSAGVTTITSDTGLNIYTSTNGVGAEIAFSDVGARSQKGFITYFHADSASYGSANSFVITGDQTTMTILADGKLMYKEGVYLKPATGTGGGTRKDNLWDAAYNDKITGLAVTGTTTKTLTATQQDGGTLTATWTDNDSGGTVTGTGANTQVAFWTGTSVIDGSSDLRWDNTNKELGIGRNPDYPLDVYKSSSTSGTATGTTMQRLWNYVGADLSQQKTFIDFVFQDDNDNEYPQVRIGAEVGQNGDANSTIKEGSGAFVVYTNNATGSTPGTNSLTERMRVDYAGNVGINDTSPSHKLSVVGTANFTGLVSGITPTAAANFATKAYVDAHPGSGGTVTSVATGNGLTGGTITTTGTLSLDRPNSQLGAVLATYGTTAGASGRIRCTAPFNTNTGKMFSIEITLYGSYTQHNYVVSAYMYSTTNQWYSPKAIYTTTGTATPDIIVGRDANGKAYISIANANYTGVLVHNMTRGYQTSLADTYDPWTIAVNAGTENSVAVATSQVWTTANHTPGNYLPLSGGTLTGATATASGISFTVGGTLTANGGINGLTLANGGINGSNYNIAGVNQLTIADPGEGIVFTGTTTLTLAVIDDTVDDKLKLTNATQLDLNSTAKITNLVNPTSAQDGATKAYVDAHPGSGGTVTSVATGNGLTGGTITSTGTLSMSGTYSGTFQESGAHGSSQIGCQLPAANNGASTGVVNLRMWCSEPGVTWDWAGFGYNVTNNNGSPGGFGRLNTAFGQAYQRYGTTGNMYFYNTNTSGTRVTTLTLNNNGQATFGYTVTAPTFVGALTGNAATATTFSTGRTNYKGVTDGAVAGQLMWKNYGNNHTIFDASSSTSPNGGSVNNTNSAIAWSATYPTLMGWNGTSTYGVRVDSARIADSAANQGNYLLLSGGTMSGQLTMSGQTISMGNGAIININNLTFNDPGVGEGVKWNGGNLWQIYESPNNLTNAAGNLQFVQNTTRRMTIDTSGNVDIGTQTWRGGTSNPIAKLNVEVAGGRAINIYNTEENGASLGFVDSQSNGSQYGYISWSSGSGNPMTINNMGQDAITINGSGDVGINNTSPQTTLHTGPTTTITNVFTARFAASNFFASGGNSMFYVPNTAANIMMFGSNQFGTNQIEFYHKNPGTSQAYVGRISTSSSATSYVTSSDYRLKENIVPISDSISRLNQLKPSRFNFIEEPGKIVDGFIAHEVQDIVPEAIVGEKDEVDEDGGIIPQGIDQAKLVPLLVAAVQELEARVKELENK